MYKLSIILTIGLYFLIGSEAVLNMCGNQIEIPTFHPANTNTPYTAPGLSHRLFCAFGYYDPIRRPIIKAVCGEDGTWYAKPPCKPKQCPDPNPILGGLVSLPRGSTNVGSNTAKVMCNEGFELHPLLKPSGGVLTCAIIQPNVTQWLPSDPKCVPQGWTPPPCRQVCKEECE